MSLIYVSISLMLISSEAFGHGIQKRQVPAVKTTGDYNRDEQFEMNYIKQSNSKIVDIAVRNSIQELALDLAYEQGSVTNGNILLSPLSIGALLSLLMLGTADRTSDEIKTALYYAGKTDEMIHSSYQTIIEDLNPNVPGVEVTMTNQLFVQRGISLKRAFTEKAKLYYKAEVQHADFDSNPMGVVRDVNQYVSEATNGKIDELIQQPFSSNALFVAVNTIYFNGLWENPFTKLYTYNGTFYTGTSTIDIPMMVNEGKAVRYLSGDYIGFDMIALPYKGDRYSMYILTPTGETSIEHLEHSLDSVIINSLIKQMQPRHLRYTIPRMKMRQRINLKDNLKKLGIDSMFRPFANFKNMTTEANVYVEQVVHEALLEISETGTVAAASTAGTSDRILPKSYVFDRSSLLFIRDDTNGVILFWAKVVEPTPLYT